MVRGMMEQEKQFIAGRVGAAKAKQAQAVVPEPAAVTDKPLPADAAADAGGVAPMEVELMEEGGGAAAGNAAAAAPASATNEVPAVPIITAAPPPADTAPPLPPLQPPTPQHSQVLESLLSPQLRAELQAACIGIFNEPDSENDGGPEEPDLDE